jgi:hypothetical protein
MAEPTRVTGPGGEAVGTVIDAGPTFGQFVVSETGQYLPYAKTDVGTFVQQPGQNWSFYTPPAGGTQGGGTTEQQQCEPGKVRDEVTGECVTPEELTRRQNQRRLDEEQKRREDEQRRRDEQQRLLDEQTSIENRRLRQQSAEAIINDLLASYGLESLSKFIVDEMKKGDITNTSALVQMIRKRPEYAARFPGVAKRAAAGFNAISEQEYIDLEQSYRRTLRAAGLPAGFYDNQDDFANLIGGDVSVAEVGQRIQQGYQAVAQANPQVINEMRRLYGVDDSALAAYFLDPERATPILLRQAQAAQIAGQATIQAGREISAAQAEELAVAGVSEEQARQGFQTIGQAGELFVALPGTTEQAITEQEQIAGVFGTQAAAQQRLRQRQRERQAIFEAGGRFAGQGTTVTGLQ